MKKISKANIKKFNYEVKNIIRNYDPKVWICHLITFL